MEILLLIGTVYLIPILLNIFLFKKIQKKGLSPELEKSLSGSSVKDVLFLSLFPLINICLTLVLSMEITSGWVEKRQRRKNPNVATLADIREIRELCLENTHTIGDDFYYKELKGVQNIIKKNIKNGAIVYLLTNSEITLYDLLLSLKEADRLKLNDDRKYRIIKKAEPFLKSLSKQVLFFQKNIDDFENEVAEKATLQLMDRVEKEVATQSREYINEDLKTLILLTEKFKQ